jgi:hypothetical protein
MIARSPKRLSRETMSWQLSMRWASVVDAAAFYAPYIPLRTTPITVSREVTPIVNFRTRYGYT